MKLQAGDKNASKAKIKVDGVDVTESCYFADDEAGYVKCYTLDKNKMTPRQLMDGEPVPETIRGKVEITLE